MKYTSAFVIAALLGACSVQDSQAVKLGAGFTDDLVKSLAEDMQKDAEAQDTQQEQEEKKPAEKVEKKEQKKEEKKKTEAKKERAAEKKDKKADKPKDKKKADHKKEDEQEIPMDQAAIKAYSSVIADAAEDSEPAVPVQYHQTMTVEKEEKQEPFQIDPMGSMIQNEISAIKDASIQAAKEKMDD